MPRNMKRFNALERQEERLTDSKRNYLRVSGWRETCQTPGALWLWERKYQGKTILTNMETAVVMQSHFDSGIYTPDD